MTPGTFTRPLVRRLYFTYVLAALLPVGLFVLVQIPLLWQWNRVQHTYQQRTEITEEILKLQRLTADIENGFRGYVLTSQSAFLHTVVSGQAQVHDRIERLMRLTGDLPALQARVKVLSDRLREFIAAKRSMVSQIDDGKHEEVLTYIRAGEGLVLSKTIEKAIEDLDARIEDEFSRLAVDETSLKYTAVQVLLFADLLVLLLGILVTRIVFRSASLVKVM